MPTSEPPPASGREGGDPGRDEVIAVDDLLEGRHPSGVHALVAADAADDLAAAVGAQGWRCLALALEPTTAKAGLLSGLARAGGFPDRFGGNWDALQDGLRDLSWAPAEGYVVLLDGWAEWADRAPDDAAVLADVLGAAAAWWADNGTPFHALLRG
jgi:hypothetical protein